jgi:succinyl-diaminopimelate desuccinylase
MTDDRGPIGPKTSEREAAPVPPGLSAELSQRLLAHCAVTAVTGAEAPLADLLEVHYRARGEQVPRHGDSLVVGTPADTRPRVLLVGHLDVVPPTDDDRVPRQEQRDGREIIIGRGASDMKSGNVVAMHLFEDAALRTDSPFALTLVLYAGEEGPASGNQLAAVLRAAPWLTEAALAIVLEPTDGRVELGCLGGIHAHVTFCGRAAHSARPWQGRNALTAAGRLLAALDEHEPVDVQVDGIAYRDVLSATQAWTGGLGPQVPAARPVRNVIPDRFTLNLNLRFAPSRDLAAAEEELRAWVTAHAGSEVPVEFEVVDRVPPAPPHRTSPLVDSFLTVTAASVAGKQAWTDVARFTEVGVPALNFGPGATAQAHQRGEWVEVAALTDAATRLRHFLTTPWPER